MTGVDGKKRNDVDYLKALGIEEEEVNGSWIIDDDAGGYRGNLCYISYAPHFDYLRDNMVIYKENIVQRPLNYAIVDEIDSILIDEARTPLIISGGRANSGNLYVDADRAVKKLKEVEDYDVDVKTKNVSLTEEGSKKIEKNI